MHEYTAKIDWVRSGSPFLDNRYSRRHEWSFDGGVSVVASSSPSVVPVPYSVLEAVDPEEALVASASSCHMLWFLSFAAKRGFVVDKYEDHPVGVMGKNSLGKIAFIKMTLHPKIQFLGSKTPSADELEAMHHDAHESCFIANSLNCEFSIEPQS